MYTLVDLSNYPALTDASIKRRLQNALLTFLYARTSSLVSLIARERSTLNENFRRILCITASVLKSAER
jgi:hypothetical protein